MNANAVAKNYGSLTPDERARLILAAGTRGDEAEQKRLIAAGKRLKLSMPDYAPFAHAFTELAHAMFLGFLEEAAEYFDAFQWMADAEDSDQAETEDESEDENAEDAEAETPTDASEADTGGNDGEECLWENCFRLALAKGFTVKTKAEGWKLFCERLGIPPFALWRVLPGFDRLHRALRRAEKAAFVPEGMARWLNAIRPDGGREATVESLMSAEKIADELEKMLRLRVERWRG